MWTWCFCAWRSYAQNSCCMKHEVWNAADVAQYNADSQPSVFGADKRRSQESVCALLCRWLSSEAETENHRTGRKKTTDKPLHKKVRKQHTAVYNSDRKSTGLNRTHVLPVPSSVVLHLAAVSYDRVFDFVTAAIRDIFILCFKWNYERGAKMKLFVQFNSIDSVMEKWSAAHYMSESPGGLSRVSYV